MNKFSVRDDIVPIEIEMTTGYWAIRRLPRLVKEFGKVIGKIPTVPKAKKKREQVLAFMDGNMDYGMILDMSSGFMIFKVPWQVRSILIKKQLMVQK